MSVDGLGSLFEAALIGGSPIYFFALWRSCTFVLFVYHSPVCSHAKERFFTSFKTFWLEGRKGSNSACVASVSLTCRSSSQFCTSSFILCWKSELYGEFITVRSTKIRATDTTGLSTCDSMAWCTSPYSRTTESRTRTGMMVISLRALHSNHAHRPDCMALIVEERPFSDVIQSEKAASVTFPSTLDPCSPFL